MINKIINDAMQNRIGFSLDERKEVEKDKVNTDVEGEMKQSLYYDYYYDV